MEQVNNKNKRLTIIVGALLLVIGISFAYFLATTLINGNGASTKVTTARINGATIQVDGNIEFEDLDILPGHKNISSVKLTATGNNQTVPYNLIWQGTNGLNTPLNYTVYKTSNEVTSTSTCNQVSGIVNGMSTISESCTISNIDQLGSVIASGTINKSEAETKITLVQDEMIQATKSGAIVYYYVVLEYPNLDEIQDSDMGGTFEGVVTVEGSTAQADISIVGIYQESEDKSYIQVNEIPSSTSSYVLDEERSSCTNNATPIWNKEDWSLEVNNLNTSGTDCNLYFKKKSPSDETLENIGITNPKEPTENMFASAATTDEGMFKVADPMYGTNAYSYYYRGAVTNNYVKFAGFCWRIIRINGDGSIRMIYDGTTCHANGTGTAESIAKTSTAYNSSYNASYYVGYTWEAKQRPANNATASASNLKTQTDSWYKTNISDKGYDDKVAEGKFCNDRNTASGYTWAAAPSSTFYYAARGRLESAKTPTLACDTGDVYTLKAGAITADEVSFAGGVYGTGNSKYYLYNGQYYWTMSPYNWWYSSSSSRYAYVFFVFSDGQLGWTDVGAGKGVYSTLGVRPVINLRSDITFSSGNGEQNTPFVVAD